MKQTIRSLRRSAEMTQAQLAALLGCQQKDVSRWESGKNVPKAKTLLALSSIFGVPIENIATPKFEPKQGNASAEKRTIVKKDQVNRMSDFGSFSDRIPSEWFLSFSLDHLVTLAELIGTAYNDGVNSVKK